jgi:hypothetical protein
MRVRSASSRRGSWRSRSPTASPRAGHAWQAIPHPSKDQSGLIAIRRAKTTGTIIRGFERADMASGVAVYRPAPVPVELKRGREA